MKKEQIQSSAEHQKKKWGLWTKSRIRKWKQT